MKKIWLLILSSVCFVGPVLAGYEFTDTLGQTAQIDVEYWTGSGDHETILVIDWNQAGAWTTASHAFGYRWDGSATTLSQMFDAIATNGGLEITEEYSTQFGMYYITNFLYTDLDGDQHTHVQTELGSFNYASTVDVYGQWGEINWTNFTVGDWNMNYGAPEDEYIADGQLEGVNACYYYTPGQVTQPLDVPYSVPEPITLALMSLGGIMIRKRK